MKPELMAPPLTPEDIITLRGEPAAKCIETNEHQEEWVYVSYPAGPVKPQQSRRPCRESYFFRNGRLVGWRKKPV